MDKKFIILNIGGTLNKIYDPIKGELIVPKDSRALALPINATYRSNQPPKIEGLIYKDSLEMTKSDRRLLLQAVVSKKETKIIIVHGTDTMKKSARILASFIPNKTIIFVGAMQPLSIDPYEASMGLGMAIGFLQKKTKKGVFVCMNGLIKKYTAIKKNYTLGVFECHK